MSLEDLNGTTPVDDLSFATLLSEAQTLDETMLVIRRALEGATGSDGEGILPHHYIATVHGELPRHVREELEEAVLRLMTRLADGEAWHVDASVELLLLSRTIFASRQRAAAAELAVARIFHNMHAHPSATILAAGQAAIGLGYYGEPAQWHRLYDTVGNDSVPIVIGGLMKTSWQALLNWLRERLPDRYVERTIINLMPYFFVTQGTAKVAELMRAVWDDIDDDAREELTAVLARAGLDTPTVATQLAQSSAVASKAANWREEFRAIFAGEREIEIAEAGGAGQYVRSRLRAAGTDEGDPAFAKALKERITKWQVGRSNSVPVLDPMFSLVAEFNQSHGITKILELLEQRADTDLDEAKTIRDASFETLNRIYNLPPQNAVRDKTYGRYIKALRTLAVESDLAPGAIRRLLELDAVDFDDRVFGAGIVNDDRAFLEAFDFAMNFRGQASKVYLSWLLEACVASDESACFEHFVDLLKERCSSVAVLFNCIEVTPDLRVSVRRDLLVRYALLMGIFVNRGLKIYHEVLNSKD